MSSPATSTPASVVSLNNDLLESPPSFSTLSDIDDSFPLTLDSFIPILSHLPGFYLDQNIYYIRGSITKSDWARLRDYTQMVFKFIVTDVVKKDSKAQISPTTFLRLARLQQPDMPLLPSLSDLVIVDANASIAYLELLLTPSLKSLEASCIPDAQQSAFFSFLTAIEQEAPLLQTLILGPGRFLSGSIQIIPKFNNLRHLELKNEDSELPLAFFDNIGSLPKLETLILDARYVSSPVSENQPNSTEEPTPTSTSGGFNQLVKLHIVGWLPLLQDLIPHIMSTKLEDVSVTFIRLSDDELKVSLEKEKAEQERRAEEKRRREEAEMKWREQEKFLREQAEKQRREEDKLWREAVEQKKREEMEKRRGETKWSKGGAEHEMRAGEEEMWASAKGPMGFEELMPPAMPPMMSPPTPMIRPLSPIMRPPSPMTCPASPMIRPASPVPVMNAMKVEMGRKKKRKGKVAEISQQRREEARMIMIQKERKVQEAREVRERLLKGRERERQTRVSLKVYTVPFTELLRMLCRRCAASLKTVSVCQLDKSFRPLFKLPTLPEKTFRRLLLLPAIESLELNGWMLDSVESVLNTAESIPNLKSLLLSLDETISGISLFTLRRVAEICPKLESLQCRIEPLSLIPEYAIPATNALSHGLRELSVGNSSPLPNAKQLHLIARHLYLLFPNLETISTFKEYNEEQWVIIDDLMKMCQTARKDDMNRPSVSITQ